MSDLFNEDVLEFFGTGTAVIITSVHRIQHQDKELVLTKENTVAKRIFKELTQIQYGVCASLHSDWSQVIKE